MSQIVGYYPDTPTWRKKSEQQYKVDFTYDFAISYLTHEIKESIDREMNCISSGGNAGFYAAVRFLFPEVTHLGNLYFGNTDDSKEPFIACRYMKRFKILPPAPGLYYDVFRNGLMHSHHPKWLRKTKGSWYISNDKKLDKNFGIFTKEFADQIKKSIDRFIDELKKDKARSKNDRRNNVYNVLTKCGSFITKNKLKEYARKDFSKLKVKNL